MAEAACVEDHTNKFAEEIVKHLLLKDFGIYWDPVNSNLPKLELNDFYTSCVLFSEAVAAAWKKYYAAIEDESLLIFNSLDSSVKTEQIYSGLKNTAKKVNLQDDFVVFIVMATFGELCVRICKSGAESLISNAVSAAKMYIVDEGLVCKGDLQVNSVNFIEFCEKDSKP